MTLGQLRAAALIVFSVFVLFSEVDASRTGARTQVHMTHGHAHSKSSARVGVKEDDDQEAQEEGASSAAEDLESRSVSVLFLKVVTVCKPSYDIFHRFIDSPSTVIKKTYRR